MSNLLNLPNELLEKIISYLSYDEVSQVRLVCKQINFCAQTILNQGFYKVAKYHAKCLRSVKSQLPRRESERRKHPLARHSEILTAVETRIALLNMTFMKYVESNCCCFIPGKVLDEIYKVLRYVTTEHPMIRTHELLQELRDISSMAMEHFDEKIAPMFSKCKSCCPKISINRFGELNKFHAESTNTNAKIFAKNGGSENAWGTSVFPSCFAARIHLFKHGTGNPANVNVNIDGKLCKINYCMKMFQKKNKLFRKDLVNLQKKLNDDKQKITELEKKIAKQHNIITAQAAKIDEQDLKVEEINRKMADFDKVISTMRESLKFLNYKNKSPELPPAALGSCKRKPENLETLPKRQKK